jgi:hypothetical protein
MNKFECGKKDLNIYSMERRVLVQWLPVRNPIMKGILKGIVSAVVEGGGRGGTQGMVERELVK